MDHYYFVLLFVLSLNPFILPYSAAKGLFGIFGRKPTIATEIAPPQQKPPPTSPPKKSCIACYGDMTGIQVAHTKYSGFTVEQKDGSCLSQCLDNPGCDFWVRAVKSNDCWLRQGFKEYVDMETTEDRRGGFRRSEEDIGLVFIKQPKTGGETLAEILAQYSVRYGRRVLHDVACINNRNPMGQANCACKVHFVQADVEHLPASDPLAMPRFTMLYTHMFYSPEVITYFMPPPVSRRLITIVRNPIDVLKSAQKMAIVQRHTKTDQLINNSFCQPLAHDMELWLTKCPMASNGIGSILQYLDPQGHDALSNLLNAAKGKLKRPDKTEVQGALERAKKRLHTFVIGSQSHFDESMLLFERSDIFYSLQSMVMHSARAHPLAKKVDEDWADKKEDMLELLRLRYSPIEYHIELFEEALTIHQMQMSKYVGDSNQVALALELYRLQNEKFTNCYENHKNQKPFNTCSQKGLWEAARVRKYCAANMHGHSTHLVEDVEETVSDEFFDHSH